MFPEITKWLKPDLPSYNMWIRSKNPHLWRAGVLEFYILLWLTPLNPHPHFLKSFKWFLLLFLFDLMNSYIIFFGFLCSSLKPPSTPKYVLLLHLQVWPPCSLQICLTPGRTSRILWHHNFDWLIDRLIGWLVCLFECPAQMIPQVSVQNTGQWKNKMKFILNNAEVTKNTSTLLFRNHLLTCLLIPNFLLPLFHIHKYPQIFSTFCLTIFILHCQLLSRPVITVWSLPVN